MTKRWTKEDIIELLAKNDKAIAKALVRLYERQTADEQDTQNTRYRNGKGFRPCHARMGTSVAEFFKRNGYITSKQANYWRQTDKKGNMRIGIYAGQLMEHIE